MADHKSYKGLWVKGDPLDGGGQGEVFLCTPISGSEKAALKILKSQKVSERRIRIFQEAKALKKLNHPNVAKYIDSNSEFHNDPDYKLYLVTEFIPGTTLANTDLSEKSLEEKIDFMKSLCMTVSYCHEMGIIHRDIKPDNIMLRDDFKDPVLIDFGISFNSIEKENDFSTIESQHIGNRFLILPEQKTGIANKRDETSDVTCLAGIFFYILTEEQPTTLLDGESKKPHQRDAAKAVFNNLEPYLRQKINAFFDTAFNYQTDQRWPNCDKLYIQLDLIEKATPTKLESTDQMIEFIKEQTNNQTYLSAKTLSDLRSEVFRNHDHSLNMVTSALGDGWGSSININAPEKFKGFGRPKRVGNTNLNVWVDVYIAVDISGNELVVQYMTDGKKHHCSEEVLRVPYSGDIDWNGYKNKLKEQCIKAITQELQSKDS